MAPGVPTTTNISLIFMVFRGLLTPTKCTATGSRIKGTLAFRSDLLIDPLSKTSSVSSTSLSATQPLNALSFTAMDSSRLPILLLVMFILLFGSWTLV